MPDVNEPLILCYPLHVTSCYFKSGYTRTNMSMYAKLQYSTSCGEKNALCKMAVSI